MKWKYTDWYSGEIAKALGEGKDDTNIMLKLSILKPLHAKWILELYDYVISEKGCGVIANGWKAARITEMVGGGSQKLESLDPFAVLDPLENSSMVPTL